MVYNAAAGQLRELPHSFGAGGMMPSRLLPGSEGDSTSAGGGEPLLSWDQCDLFCINSYAGVPTPACGWRGRSEFALWDATRQVRLCPRCGQPTLLEIDKE